VLDAVLAELVGDGDRLRDGIEGGTDEDLPLPGAGDSQDGLGSDGFRSDETRPAPVGRPAGISRVEDDLVGGRLRSVPVADAVLEELAAAVGWPGWAAGGAIGLSVARPPSGWGPTDPTARISEHEVSAETGGPAETLAVALLAAGLWAHRGMSTRP
jgi:hypothetical protein